MAITSGQQRAMRTLQQRKQAGNIGGNGMRRLEALRAAQQSSAPAVAGNILGGAGGGAKKPQRGGNLGMGPAGNFGGNRIGQQGNQLTGSIFDTLGDSMSSGAIQGSMRPLDFNALPSAPGTQDLAAERQRIEGSLYDKYTRDFETEKSREMAKLQQQMAEDGIPMGSGQKYSNLMDDFNKRWDRRDAEARQDATATGGQEWERTYGIGRTGRADALGEQVTDRQFPISQAGGLLGLGSTLSGIGMGYANLAGQQRENKLNRRQQWKMANMNRGGGGAAPSLSPPPAPFNF